ncbi:hypothetical protein KP509_01G121500 [Ceratopteris richardii]|uniref:Two-component response regulator n=1 Tax=Ceratopteris richardii TaxID=49495 RepID=A0A8T2VNR8_CERRI|nr:hypothetical protein KP509_01G121500 [Ceratopteris richardii]
MNLSSSSPSSGTRKHCMGSFSPAGLHVLVVDDDPLCLMVLERMLKQCSYNVTTCNRVNLALQLLREKGDQFDIVLSDVYMPDEDGFKLLEVIGLELDLPVITNGETSVVMQGITHGACDYLIKPIRVEELRNIWQHVIRRKGKEMWKTSIQGDLGEASKGHESQDQVSKKRKESFFEIEDCEMDGISSNLKKARVNWSMELHRQFVDAVNQLGVDKAVPKRILEIMNVQGLTRENVASHLQKYRLYLKRLSGVIPEPCPIASFQASTDGTIGGAMLVQPAGKAPIPTVGVKGRNLGAGIGSGTGKNKKIDKGTLESLAKYRLHQKQYANRAQVLGGLGLSDSQASSSALPRMSSLDLGFLLQGQDTEFFNDNPVDAVDDLAACSFRRVKLEDDTQMSVFGVNNKRTYPPPRHVPRRLDHVHQSSMQLPSDEQKCKRFISSIARPGESNVCAQPDKLELGSPHEVLDTVGGYMSQVTASTSLIDQIGDCEFNPKKFDVMSVAKITPVMDTNTRFNMTTEAGLDEGHHKMQVEKDRADIYGENGFTSGNNNLTDLADLVDDSVSSTNVELSTVSSATDASGDGFSESSFTALAQLSGMMSPSTLPRSLDYAVSKSELDLSDYLQFDDGFGF